MKCKLWLPALLFLVGCSSSNENKLSGRSPETIYEKGINLLKAGEYTDAASEFKDIEAYFPYSAKAVDGQVLAAYSYFLAKSYNDAIQAVDIFLRYHPSHELVPYALYLKAMSLYMMVGTIGRDASGALDAKEAFVELVNRFPQSPYYRDSIKRILLLDDMIAAHEMAIGRYYQKNKNALAAIGRYNLVVNRFAKTKHAEEACYRIVECCNSLGMKEDAYSMRLFMQSHCPKSIWTEKACAMTPGDVVK